jgi:hypothetical protein
MRWEEFQNAPHVSERSNFLLYEVRFTISIQALTFAQATKRDKIFSNATHHTQGTSLLEQRIGTMILPTEKQSGSKGHKRKTSMKGSTKFNTRGQKKRDWKKSKEKDKGCPANLKVKASKRKQTKKPRKNKP